METAAPQEQQAQQERTTATSTTSRRHRDLEESRAWRTPLQRLQDTLRRKFGSEIIRTSTTNAKETEGRVEAQRHQGTTMELHNESQDQINRRPWKAPMNVEQAQDRRTTATTTLTSTSPSIRYLRCSNLTPPLGESGPRISFLSDKGLSRERIHRGDYGLWQQSLRKMHIYLKQALHRL